jgi:hypothetical protein
LQTGNQFSSFNHVQQDHHHSFNDIFKQLLINPGRLSEEQMSQLQALADRFPQMGLLHALQARYSGDTAHLSRAAASFSDSAVLQKIVLRTSGLPAVNEAQIIFKNNDPGTEAVVQAEAVTDVLDEAQPKAVEVEPVIEAPIPEDSADTQQQATVDINEEQLAESTEVLPEETVAQPAPATEELPVEQVEEDALPAELPVAETESPTEETPQVEPEVKVEDKAKTVAELPVAAPAPLAETQQLIIENIAANNYFVFDSAFIDRNRIVVNAEKDKAAEPETPFKNDALAVNTEEGQVTRYHDDKMPYSFLWWLDKTRSKHNATYQPYVIKKKPVAPQTSKAEAEVTAEVPEERKKEDGILERFLQEDPQIKPPTGDKLDNENKARHSSEDQDEMITETLARIYADQMLYSKAIAAYKILILKNPEKRRYFANQIEILQKKIN